MVVGTAGAAGKGAREVTLVGGGVDGAIHKKEAVILNVCRKLVNMDINLDGDSPVVSAAVSQPPSTVRSSFLRRMLRALKLQSSLYEEVEHDPQATIQGVYVIAIVSLAQAIGRALDKYLTGETPGNILIPGVLGFIETVVGLAIWSYLLYLIGTKVFKGVATPSEVWRTTSYARSPGVFLIIPFVGPLVNIWILVAYVIAARQALDLSTGRTIVAAIVSAIPFLIIQGLVVLLLFGT